MSLKAVIFDVDGTLANNDLLCVAAYQQTLERYTGRPFTDQEIRSHFGKSDEGILGVFLPPEKLTQVLDEYYNNYERIHCQDNVLFPGMMDLIQRLHAAGIRMGVVTGKSRRGTEITLRVLGLEPYMSAVESGFESGPNKPESLRRVLAKFGLQANEAVYVGDMSYDIEAASSIGMPVVGAAWAETHTIRNGAGEKALHIFTSVKDFETWLNQVLQTKSL